MKASNLPAPATSSLRLLERVVVAGCCVGLLSWSGLLLSSAVPGQSVIWLANGTLLAFLLATPRQEWPWYLGAAVVSNAVAGMIFHFSVQASVLFSIVNMAEVLLAASLLLGKVKGYPDLTHPPTLARFGLYCVLVAPALSAMLAGAATALLGHAPVFFYMGRWFVADALGMALMTPLMLAMRPDQLREIVSGKRLLESIALLSVLAATTIAVFSQSRYPVTFLIFPLLLLVMFRLGRAGTAVAIFLICGTAIHFTLLSRGPFALLPAGAAGTPVAMLQLFFSTLVLMMYGATAALSEHKHLSNDLRESEELYRILADHSWDIIVRTDLEGRTSYLSPSVLDVVGWTPEELLGTPSTELIHPEDQVHHRQMWSELTNNNAKLVYTYRMKTKEGGYLWVEAKARLVADPATGEPREVVSVIRDVSARVAEQQQLMRAFRHAEVLAKVDTLTGLANRRGFDDALQGEWRRAIRDKTPISLLMVDVDDFKAYNDAYGHPAGDECLQAIGYALAHSLQRSSDLAARYGGEEFAILLPNTPEGGAKEIAERIRLAVSKLHRDFDDRVCSHTTVSIGLAAAQPRRDGEQDSFVSTADQALYSAKRNGKNQVVSG